MALHCLYQVIRRLAQGQGICASATQGTRMGGLCPRISIVQKCV